MKKQILVVDDNGVMLKLMTDLLEQLGHQVLTAKDGLSALEILKTCTPKVVFVDLIMPNISGEKLCRIIRGLPRLQKTFLVVLSAIAVEEQPDFLAFGANACIAKGRFEEVATHVTALLDQLETPCRSPQILGAGRIRPRVITREILSSRKHFETIINHMREAVVEVTPAGRIIAINPSGIRLLGGEERTILAADFQDFFNPPHRLRFAGLLREALRKPQTITEDHPLTLADRQVALQMLPLFEGGEEPAVILLIFRDVTRWKQSERELEIYRHHLEDLVRERNAELQESN